MILISRGLEKEKKGCRVVTSKTSPSQNNYNHKKLKKLTLHMLVNFTMITNNNQRKTTAKKAYIFDNLSSIKL